MFSDIDSLKLLNSVTHKYILKNTQELTAQYKKDGKKAVLIDAPVLFESGFDKYCDILLCVTCPDEKSIERICRRDGIDEENAKLRLSSQIPADKLRSLCDYEIVNDDVTDPVSEVKRFLSYYSLD